MRRRNLPEAMDERDLDPDLLAEDLHNLETLNRLFGGRGVIRRRLGALVGELPPGRQLTVLDVGSGAGELCRVVIDECRRYDRSVRVVSLDAHPQIQDYARSHGRSYPELAFVRGDARSIPLRTESVDLALCTLALHHFAEEDAVAVLAEMRRVTRRFALVSDLYRGCIAYGAVWLATRAMRNPMTRRDGPLSVQRAFTSLELLDLARRAGWEGAGFHAEPWFRMSLVYRRFGRW